MTDLSPVPTSVIQSVNEYVRSEKGNAEKYENRQPLDESGTWSLHALARSIYASGWSAGYWASTEAERGNRV